MKVRSVFLKPLQVIVGAVVVALVAATGAGLYPLQPTQAATASTTGSGVIVPHVSTAGTRHVTRISAVSTMTQMSKAQRISAYKAYLAMLAARRAAAARSAIVALSPWSSARVSWYGPGFYGHTMAGGGALTPESMVVAHRTMKFGTKIQITYNGKTTVAVVKDRGPYVAGRMFDLGPGTAHALGFSGVGTITWRIIK